MYLRILGTFEIIFPSEICVRTNIFYFLGGNE